MATIAGAGVISISLAIFWLLVPASWLAQRPFDLLEITLSTFLWTVVLPIQLVAFAFWHRSDSARYPIGWRWRVLPLLILGMMLDAFAYVPSLGGPSDAFAYHPARAPTIGLLVLLLVSPLILAVSIWTYALVTQLGFGSEIDASV